jgi:hypothetical protein
MGANCKIDENESTGIQVGYAKNYIKKKLQESDIPKMSPNI